MRKFRFLLTTLLLLAITFGAHAEDKVIKRDFKVRQSLNALNTAEAVALLNPNTSFAEIQMFDFGDEGATVLLHLKMVTNPDENGEITTMENTFSWSGKWLVLGYSSNEDGQEGYVPMYGNQPCDNTALVGVLKEGKKFWFLNLTDNHEVANFMAENLQGMDVDALRAHFLEKNVPGRLSAGKRMGEYMVYELLSIGTRKRYQSGGDYYYEANANTPYIRFYFKNGKLEKWLFLEK